MKASQIEKITVVNEPVQEIIETHISWVLLTQKYVYKIKKPVRFSFLDFSTLQKRKHFCEEELQLNKRLTKGMYLDVVPILKKGDHFIIGINEGDIVEYAVKMKRIAASKQMHLLLKKGKVTQQDIEKVTNKLIPFHQNAKMIKKEFDEFEMKENFNEIQSIQPFVKEELGEKYEQIINASIDFSNQFIEKNRTHFEERIQKGMIRDGHGDLHSSNIFMEEEPIIFDCIEFNSKLRTKDILNELAFFCIDLDAYGHQDLSVFFIKKYQQLFPEVLQTDFDGQLFLYYKMYCANIRAKVNALKAKQLPEGKEKMKARKEVTLYLQMIKTYLAELQYFSIHQ